MNKLKLSYRIALAFGALIAIALFLGGYAALEMNSATRQSTTLSKAKVPEVTVANDIERSYQSAMLEIRTYGLTGDDSALASGLKNIEEVKAHLKEVDELVAKVPSLEQLKVSSDSVDAKVAEYEKYIKETAALDKTMEANRARMDTEAKAFMAVSHAFLEHQTKSLKEEITTNTAPDKLEQRFLKTTLINDIIDAGNAIRLAAWRAQAERNPKLIEDAQKNFDTIKSKLAELRPITKLAINVQQIADCQKAAEGYQAAMLDLAKNWTANTDVAAKSNTVAIAALAEVEKTATLGLNETRDSADTTAKSLSATTTLMLIGLTLAAITGGLIAFFMTRSITGPIQSVATTLAAGAEQTTSAAGQVSSASQSLAEGASEQAASLEETSSSLEELASMTKRNTDNAQKVNELSKQTRVAADTGVSDMQLMSGAMDAIKTSSDDIAKIIKTIDEIAFQTNILALNAAVEAARAGEAGMGFAVVAEEVRALAQRSAQASKETAAKIEGAITKTGQGVQLSAKVALSLNEIATKARQVDELAAEVANASREQSQGIEQINIAVGQMDQVTQANAGGAEESASAAEELNAQAECLKEAVNELQRLVDGGSGVRVQAATPHHVRPIITKPAVKKTPFAKTEAAASVQHRNAATNGNGHEQKPFEAPARGSITAPRSLGEAAGD